MAIKERSWKVIIGATTAPALIAGTARYRGLIPLTRTTNSATVGKGTLISSHARPTIWIPYGGPFITFWVPRVDAGDDGHDNNEVGKLRYDAVHARRTSSFKSNWGSAHLTPHGSQM